jgi:Transposase IS4
MAPDLRKVIGSIVTCKATQVTSLQECLRRYGSNAKTKLLDGTVLEVIVDRTNPTNRAQTYLQCDWVLGNDRTKREKVHIRFTLLKEVVAPPIPPVEPVVNDDETASSHEDNTNDNIQNINNVNNDNVNNEAVMNDGNARAGGNVLEVAFGDGASVILENNEEESIGEAAEAFFRRQIMVPEDVPDVEEVVATCHERAWYKYNDTIGSSINGIVPYREWGLRIPTGEVWREGDNTDETITRLEVFLQMFPTRQLNDTFTLTNIQLRDRNWKETTKREILKFIGVVILCTKYEFNNRSDLWAEHPASKYEVAPALGRRTGMKRKRFDELWSCIRFSNQPAQCPEGMSLETYRWMLIDGFIRNFNQHRANNFIPSDRICVDESFSRWYGQGGNWINHGLPMFISMERKPEDGCEIQNSSCGRTGIMLRLKLVKTSAQRDEDHEDQAHLNHGTQIILNLTQPWQASDRVVMADSYFASVQCARELLRVGLRFIGVVKTASREFPQAYLSAQELGERGDRLGLLSNNDQGRPNLLAFVWLDKDRRYFIATCSSLQEGQPHIRQRWRQLVSDLTTPPEKVELTVPQPVATETYYAACQKIDQHNRDRQATLGLERKFKTHDWAKRVNMSILSMCIVDAWRVWSRITIKDGGERMYESQKEFYGHLSAELIDNTYDSVGGQTRRQESQNLDEDGLDPDLVDPLTGLARSGDGVYLRKVTRKRKNQNHVHQGRCIECKKKTSYICSACIDDDNSARQPWICNSETGRMCFASHRMKKHDE